MRTRARVIPPSIVGLVFLYKESPFFKRLASGLGRAGLGPRKCLTVDTFSTIVVRMREKEEDKKKKEINVIRRSNVTEE